MHESRGGDRKVHFPLKLFFRFAPNSLFKILTVTVTSYQVGSQKDSKQQQQEKLDAILT